MADKLKAPFPYFGGKSKAAPLVWERFGDVLNYVEPFCGSAAMLLAAPEGKRVETINDADGFIVNFWRSVQHDADAVTYWADWPVSELDLTARHGWLINRADRLKWSLEDPDFYDAKAAGWWVWGACSWIGSGWCQGTGPHQSNGVRVIDTRQLPHLGNAGRGINRQLPHLSSGQGINRQLPHLGNAEHDRTAFIRNWMHSLADRLRDVRITCGDWKRVAQSSAVTHRHGTTAIFLDPPYAHGAMDYAAGGVGGELARAVGEWCIEAGQHPKLRIALCGHAGDHDELEQHGWIAESWKAGGGYARSKLATDKRKSETIWFSPACLRAEQYQLSMLLQSCDE
jgi:DNA adenine methylase